MAHTHTSPFFTNAFQTKSKFDKRRRRWSQKYRRSRLDENGRHVEFKYLFKFEIESFHLSVSLMGSNFEKYLNLYGSESVVTCCSFTIMILYKILHYVKTILFANRYSLFCYQATLITKMSYIFFSLQICNKMFDKNRIGQNFLN